MVSKVVASVGCVCVVLLATVCGVGERPYLQAQPSDMNELSVESQASTGFNGSTATSPTPHTGVSVESQASTGFSEFPVKETTELEPNASVERVVDGDTIVVGIGGGSETVRLIGIDTPESVARTLPVQCYGQEASRYLAGLLPVGTAVTLVRDVEARDVYDRLLAYVVRAEDNLFVNLQLVSAGYAAVLEYPPNDYYSELFVQAESDAIVASRGLWGECGGPDVPLN